MNVADRFWAKVDKAGECWLWTASTDKDGYGRFFLAGKVIKAHRHALRLAGVDIDGKQVDHICHAPPCVNPDHLRAVTQKQNQEHRAGAQANSTTGVRGVSRYASERGWRAGVQHDGQHHRKYFTDLAAAEAWVITKRNELFTHNDADKATA